MVARDSSAFIIAQTIAGTQNSWTKSSAIRQQNNIVYIIRRQRNLVF